MKKRLKFLFVFLCIFSVLFSPLITKSSKEKVYADGDLYLGGFPAGFSLDIRGAYVVGLCDVITKNGIESPSKTYGICVGDIILNINENEVNNAADIENSLNFDEQVIIVIQRQREIIPLNVKPAVDVNGKAKLGVFIRDGVNGIGTVTYINGDRFASLGHPVLDDNEKILKIQGGNIYKCKITGYNKGERGVPGELKGVFIKNDSFGSIEKNTVYGVYGKIKNEFIKENLIKISMGKGKVGDATIYTTIDGQSPKPYKISIIKVDNEEGKIKNYVIKINDKNLLEQTAGIVQGMSGSPIVQDGKLVGAVTHVFVNDPTRGFGISIDKMINN